MNNKHEFTNSSSIAHCDFDDATNTMEIKFTSGSTYHYSECTREAFEALKKAASPGAHFHQYLRKLKSKKVG